MSTPVWLVKASPVTGGRAVPQSLSLRGLADVACVAHPTVARVLNGYVLPDIGTLTRLEDALDHQLWPGPAAIRASAAARRQAI
ncbi:helix-turn-helix domain-containing protein [Streptomyces sp. NPDC058457]|uniref:helix-turn-helix domain-containing protein n=1 Tax=Streptomyces sp. NPDC058457 TaxID=3346507 RepID=UPI00366A5068